MMNTPSFDPGSRASGFGNSLQGSSMISNLQGFRLSGIDKEKIASPSQGGEEMLNVKDGNLVSPASQLTNAVTNASAQH